VSIVALVGSLMGAITTSSQSRRATRAANEAINAIEYLRTQDYIPCATVSSYANPPTNSKYKPEIVSVKWLKPDATPADPNPNPEWIDSGGSCSASTDQGAQLIRIRVTAQGAPTVRRSLAFVKRNKRCPEAEDADPETC